MKRKLFAAAVLLGIALGPSWISTSEAVAYCSKSYCKGKPSTTTCGCPPGTDRVGQASTCGSWNTVGGCWYE